MSTLSHFNKYNSFDNFFDLFFGGKDEVARSAKTLTPALDVKDGDREVTLSLELPGFSSEDIDISLDKSQLVISASHKEEKEEKDDKWLRKEISKGHYERRLTLPDNIDVKKISAESKNGILTVVLPKMAKEETVKKIAVKG